MRILHEQNADWGIVTLSVGGVHAAPKSGEIAPN